MSRYLVTIQETAEYTIEVEAPDSDLAAEKAEEIFLAEGPETSLPCTVLERDAINVEEIEQPQSMPLGEKINPMG